MKRLSSENEDGTLRKEGEAGPVRESEPGGWPAWEQQALEILSSIRLHVYEPDALGIVARDQALALRGNRANSDMALNSFLGILDAFLSQLIEWAERIDPPNKELRAWAGEKLAERLLFLLVQQKDWCNKNVGFKKRRAEFEDKGKRLRSPSSFLGWLAGDYLDKLLRQRASARLLLSVEPGTESVSSASYAMLLGLPEERISRLKILQASPEFSSDSACRWAELVYEEMEREEEKILSSPQMLGCSSRDDRERRSSGEVKLYDFKSTIIKAVKRLALKPPGKVRAITRPA